ncbi:F-box/FBD/LRR-repeat protein At1g16930-like [Silene latifolia]|uniref:F-box/FBD/LRR-repeat protein At1g16930-like n=1 Tax=Silene latifolia TaxID=37657 RepID=UPI003D770B85
MGFGENAAKVKRDTVDRISELPDFIVHTILSMLDTKEAGRASVLSKRWYGAWSSIPVLDFRPQFFRNFSILLPYKTMQRYFSQKYRIREMYLMVSMNDKKLESFIDKWIMIAVQNQIQKLEIEVDSEIIYRLPEILFCSKSLKYLECVQIELPYYETMELVSLEYLTLEPAALDDNMLQRIISSCPLVELDITCSKHLDSISLPWMRKVDGIEGCGSGTTESYLASPLQEFVFTGSSFDFSWPWKMNVVALKNLRKLEICCVSITDDIVSELVSGLIALECLVLESCIMLKCINISSASLKEFRIGDDLDMKNNEIPFEDGLDLMKVTNLQLTPLTYSIFHTTVNWRLLCR